MSIFADKVKRARAELNLSSPELAAKSGLSVRSIAAYEAGEKRPRPGSMLNLAKALQVSAKYLSDDNCDDPMAEIEKDGYIAEARKRYGASGARDIDALMKDNAALFAGGDIPQSEKDRFFEAIMRAYITCKDQAREKFGRKTDN
jgi:transcriptional regulator with XRE-family HTH domain